MDIDKYKELTGLTVSSNKEALVKANIRRTKAMLETMLGFTLEPENLYNELGKSQVECACPDVDTSNLLDPDEEQGIVKLFPYNHKDKYIHVDPFTQLYSVKLVFTKSDYEYVTVKEFDNLQPQYSRGGIAKYIEKCEECGCLNSCYVDCEDCVQVAVDADWIDCLPDDLLYIWADMVNFQLDPNKNIKSESVTGHSWSKDNVTPPEQLPQNVQILMQYAGPNGSITTMPTA